MKREIAWKEESLYRGSMKMGLDGRMCFTCPKEGLDYLVFKKGTTQNEMNQITDMNYFVVVPEVLEENSLCFQLSFYEKSGAEPAMRMIFGLLPHVEVPIPVSFEILNSQNLFPERTLGRLKMTIFGKPVKLDEVEEIRFQTTEGHKEFQIAIRELYYSDVCPEYTLEHRQLIDELGQWMLKEWEGKTADRETCNLKLNNLLHSANKAADSFEFEDWDQYGGCINLPMTKTGWFHIEKKDEKFFMVDPAGNAFISTGLDCIREGVETRIDPVLPWIGQLPMYESEKGDSKYADCYQNRRGKRSMDSFNFGIANMIEAFGEKHWRESWMKIIKYYLKQWGINTIGNWSDPDFIRFANMPYVIPIDVHAENGFPTTTHMIFRDFPDVFSPEYEAASGLYAKALMKYKSDPNLIGYFMRNEPAWAFVYELNIAEEMLANEYDTVSKQCFIKRMLEKYKTIVAFNQAWCLNLNQFEDLKVPIYKAAALSETAKTDLNEFSIEMITRYVELPAKELRKVDKNHLNLGMRYAYITDQSLLSGSENFDVFSINSYQMSPCEPMKQVGDMLNKPVMIGEFHQGALDKGLTAHGIRGVTTQQQRGNAYRYYVEQALQSPYYLGAHYFQLNDQSCLGRFDGENYQIGFIDVCMQEYTNMIDQMKACHKDMYQVALGKKAPYSEVPEYIPPIHY